MNGVDLLMSDEVKPYAEENTIDYIQSEEEEGFVISKPGETGCEGCSC